MAPWNAPVGLVTITVVPALAAGNTVILKTSENSPHSQLLAAELLKEASSASSKVTRPPLTSLSHDRPGFLMVSST